jgi:hypothetical protein
MSREAESVVEPSDDDNYMAYKTVRLLSCVNVNPRLIGELDESHSQSHTERSVHWVNGVGGSNVSALANT